MKTKLEKGNLEILDYFTLFFLMLEKLGSYILTLNIYFLILLSFFYILIVIYMHFISVESLSGRLQGFNRLRRVKY